MPKQNLADDSYGVEGEEILGHANIELSSDEAYELINYLSITGPIPDKSESLREMLDGLTKLLENSYNLGLDHVKDSEEKINIVIATEHILADEPVDPKEDAEDISPEKPDGTVEEAAT